MGEVVSGCFQRCSVGFRDFGFGMIFFHGQVTARKGFPKVRPKARVAVPVLLSALPSAGNEVLPELDVSASATNLHG